jgi:hypothetical protein
VFGVVPTIVGAWVVEAIALALIPHLGQAGLQIAAAVIGCTAIVGFVAWIAIPGLYREEIELSDIPTACGLMLTIVAIGGVALPAIYGMVAPSYGYANAWLVLGAASLVTTLCCLLIRRPGTLPA